MSENEKNIIRKDITKNGFVIISYDDFKQIFDKNGNLIQDNIKHFSNNILGTAIFRRNGKYGWIDTNTYQVIAEGFDHCKEFRNGIFTFEMRQNTSCLSTHSVKKSTGQVDISGKLIYYFGDRNELKNCYFKNF